MSLAAVPAKTELVRLFHLTFYKCGSQWIRDILSDPRVVEFTGHTLAVGGIDLQSEPWPQLEPGQFAAPLYSAGAGKWLEVATETDRAFVVIRDPRDIVVSLVYSVSLSHTPSAITRLLRAPVADASPENRLQMGMFLLAQWAEYLRTWKRAPEFPNVHLTRYAALVADLPGELKRLFAFLNWEVPHEVIDAVALENSFQNRSGRKPGEANEFSHRRKGIAGDWRNHFDRERGRLFEEAFPSLLFELGYEQNDDWWRNLPEIVVPETPTAEQNRSRLLAVLEEHENELAAIRLAAEERLRDIDILHDALHHSSLAHQEDIQLIGRLTAQVASLTASLESVHHDKRDLPASLQALPGAPALDVERLQLIGSLSSQLNSANAKLAVVSQAAQDRLDALLAAQAARKQLEQSFSWRFGYRPLRALGSLFSK